MIDLTEPVAPPWLHREIGLDSDDLLRRAGATANLGEKWRAYVLIAFNSAAPRVDFAMQCVEEAKRLAHVPSDEETAQLLMAEANCLYYKLDVERMYQKLATGKEIVSRLKSISWKGWFHYLCAAAALHSHRFAEALEEARFMLANSYSSELQPLRGRALSIAGVVSSEFGLYEEAVRFFERARSASILYPARSSPGVLSTNNIAWALHLLSEESLSRGRDEESAARAGKAVLMAQRAVEWATTNQAVRLEIDAVETLAAALISNRDFEAARAQLERLSELIGPERSDRGIVTRGIVSRAKLRLEDGDSLGAISLLEPEYRTLDGQVPRRHIGLLNTLESAYRSAGRFSEAYETSLRVTDIRRSWFRGNSEVVLRALIKNISSSHHDWLAYIAHDLRSPVSNIIALAEERGGAPDPQTTLHRIRELGQLALSSLSRYLDFARLDMGAAHFKKIQLNELIEQCLEFAEPKMSEKRLSLKLDTNDFVVVEGDWDALHRAVDNIVENAIAAAPEDSEIRVTIDARSNACVVSCHNNGKGFTENQLASLFDASLQVERARKNFGLPITAFIIETHSGSLFVENKPQGQGVCVTMVLPLA